MTPLGKRTCPTCKGTGDRRHYVPDLADQACITCCHLDGSPIWGEPGTVDSTGPVGGEPDCPCGGQITFTLDVGPPILLCDSGCKWRNGEPHVWADPDESTTRVTEAGLIVPVDGHGT